MRKAAVSVLVVIMCIFMFTGCGGGKTIEQQVSQAQLAQLNEEVKNVPMFSTTFKDAKIEIEGNHVIYKYWYKMDLDDTEHGEKEVKKESIVRPEKIEAMKETDIPVKKENTEKKDFSQSGLDSQADTLKEQFNKDYHVSDSSVSFIYYTNDNRVIVEIER